MEDPKHRSLDVEPFKLPSYNAGEQSELSCQQDLESPVICNVEEPSGSLRFKLIYQARLLQVQDSIECLLTIDAPATSQSTVHDVFCQALEIKDALKLQPVIVVFDQAMYA